MRVPAFGRMPDQSMKHTFTGLRVLRGLPIASVACALACCLLMTAARAGAADLQRWDHLTDIIFQHLTQDRGLPNEIATAVAEDADGFIWIGTLGGLARWDGHRFRVYKPDARIAGSLPDSYIQTLHRDAQGTLWIGTSGAGLARYDREQDRFVSLPGGAGGIRSVSIRSVIDDGAGGLWVAGNGGLDHFNPATGAIRHASIDGPASDTSDERVQAVLKDREGTLWVGTGKGLYKGPKRGSAPDTGAAQRFEYVPLPVPAGQLAELQSLFEDSGGRIWIGTTQHGAFVIAPGKNVALAIRDTTTPGALLLAQITSIAEIRPGEIWLATLGDGVVTVQADSLKTRHIRSAPLLSASLRDNSVRHLLLDRSGAVWLATNRGVSYHDPRQTAVSTLFGVTAPVGDSARPVIGTEISWILPAPDQRVWLGTHQSGVDIIDPASGAVKRLQPNPLKADSALPQDIVVALERAPDGGVFIGTKRGLYKADGAARRITRIGVAGRDASASTWALLAAQNTLWIGGTADGLWKLDTLTGRSSKMPMAGGQRFSDNRIFVLAPGPAGSLWVGTRNGLNRFDPATGRIESSLPKPGDPASLAAGFITTLLTDRQGRLWVGTYGGGIHRLDTADSLGVARFTRISTAQGLPNDNINALLEDQQGNIWASTDDGLVVIDPQSLSVRALRRSEGVVLPTYWTGAAAKTAAGELLFGGAGGLTIVRPELLKPLQYRPPLVATDVQIGGRALPLARLRPAANGVLAPLQINPDANSLALEFAALDYAAPDRVRYAYRLQGFDADWISSDPSGRRAAYTNLPPGNYRLQIRNTTRNGSWDERMLELPVAVLPAWYQTLWFRVLLVLAGLTAIVTVVQIRTRFLRSQQQELERRVQARTSELAEVSAALQEKSRALEEASVTDPLTGLRNRRFLTQHIDLDTAMSIRRIESQPPNGAHTDNDTIFLVVDADHFKQVNDAYGHMAGDAVLVQFGQRLQKVMRESDYLVRWGGEEFLAVARATNRDRAEELAERICRIVADHAFTLDDGRRIRMTCSVGFACLPFVAAHPRALGWQEVVNLADVALYTAKHVGRNGWVGLHATGETEIAGLPDKVRASPRALVRNRQLRLSSSQQHAAALEALPAE